MVARGTPAPKKLKRDAIVEAMLELRFDLAGVSEIFVGRLATHKYWATYTPRSTGLSNIPKQLLDSDPNLKFHPRIEAIAPDSRSALRIGEHAVVFVRKAPYPGWTAFQAELRNFVTSFFECAGEATITRLGLRYVNALTREHGISSSGDLDLSIAIAQEPLAEELNLNFVSAGMDAARALIRVATPSFLQGETPSGTRLVVDVDVSTPDGYQERSADAVLRWIDTAHGVEKDEFFHLFKQSTIDTWRQE